MTDGTVEPMIFLIKRFNLKHNCNFLGSRISNLKPVISAILFAQILIHCCDVKTDSDRDRHGNRTRNPIRNGTRNPIRNRTRNPIRNGTRNPIRNGTKTPIRNPIRHRISSRIKSDLISFIRLLVLERITEFGSVRVIRS
jgi:hypothetical protein